MVPGGVEVMTQAVTLGFQEGCIILSLHGVNTIRSVYFYQLLLVLLEEIPVATRDAPNGNARESPKLLFGTEGRATEVIPFARKV